MTEHASHDAHAAHHGPGVRAYLAVFAALSVFTLVSFLFNWMARKEYITAQTSFTVILSVAVVKAALVILYFMHVIADWRKIYYLLVVAFILATMMMIVLMPDGVLAWRRQ